MKYDVMMTPALAVDGEVKTAGKATSFEEIKKMLQARRGRAATKQVIGTAHFFTAVHGRWLCSVNLRAASTASE